MVRLNSKRTPKPSGKKKKNTVEEIEEVDNVNQNTYQRKKDEDETPQFVSNFKSSNLQGVAYNPEKKQMWVRFLDGSVYTYYNVPLNVYRNFWHASSKGSYFWDKIRRNYSIPYRKLTSSLIFIPIKNMKLSSSRITKSRYPLSLKAANNSIMLYTQINSSIQELLDMLYDLGCSGFESLSNVIIHFDEDYVYISTPKDNITISYQDGIYTIVLENLKHKDKDIIFKVGEENFVIDAANQIFAYLETR